MIRAISILAILSVASASASAQIPAAVTRGVPAPTAIVPRAVTDSAVVRLYNSVRVLNEAFVGNPAGQLRIVASWGGPTHQDCDCLLSRVTVTINYDGDDLRAYYLGELLDPAVDRMATEQERPVVYLSYGPSAARVHARVEIRKSGVRLTRNDASAHESGSMRELHAPRQLTNVEPAERLR